MDLRLYGRVLWRFKLIVILGFLVAVALAVFSTARVSTKGITYRQGELWSSTTRLLITQNGFPEGRLQTDQPTSGGQIADPNRLNSLAVLYAELATGDPVRALMLRDGPIGGKIVATPVTVGDNHFMLPLVDLMAIAASPRRAMALAARGATALGTYVRDEQTANAVPTADRVIVQEIAQPKKAKIFRKRSTTMPAVVFLAVMLLTIGLAFLLENLQTAQARGGRDDGG